MDLNQLLNPEETRSRVSGALQISGLLNPDERPVDVLPLIKELSTFTKNTELLVPLEIQNQLNLVLGGLRSSSRNNPAPRVSSSHSENENSLPRRQENDVKLNRANTLDILYHYPVDAVVEYPETSSTGLVGHLFRMDPDNWVNPILNVVYSRGKPAGQTIAGKEVFTDILRDSSTDEAVPCVHSHTTCQGSKICPYSDVDALSLPHTAATRADVKERLKNDREHRQLSASPSKDVFMRTVGYLAAIKKLGCRRPLSEETFLLESEEEERETRDLYLQQIRRGYRMPDGICEGRLVFGYNDQEEHPYICKDHFHDSTIGSGAYDVDYIEAVITGDLEEAARIEDEAADLGYGPTVECTTVSNFSTQKAYCPVPHRDSCGDLVQPLLERLQCTSKFRVYEPLEAHRIACPFILIVTTGDHCHPVPLPTKTPPHIRATLMNLLEDLDDDLPDLTPRRLLRHPIIKAFLSKRFPSLINPTLGDWHAYIKQARDLHYPFGTGWAGVVNLKAYQDAQLPKESHYIRRVLAVEMDEMELHSAEEEDDEDHITPPKDNRLRLIICLSPEASRRLLSSGRYLQSDIGFRRIVGFKEFEVAGMERDANTSIIYLRIFMNRMSALAHQRVFQEIESIVFEDTAKRLQWHHIHASSDDDGLDTMVLSWVGDQHRGQAKGRLITFSSSALTDNRLGLGLHLQKIASEMGQKADLYEPHRNIQDLSPYEHLHRIFRVCIVHFFRLVKLCATTEHVRWLMRSLVCMEHPDWDATLETIRELGGKAAQDWLSNKLSSGFVFEGICWQKSFIPRMIWEAGDSNSNLIETVHRDANREGVHCTLVGGLRKGQQFDSMKMKTLGVCNLVTLDRFTSFMQLSPQTFEMFGITPTYKTGHVSENTFTNLKRRGAAFISVFISCLCC
ncbi:hypothetical protein K438DRAFT_1596387 [Mycena galopus ATCC 62051]|nr:hypothetical protein K438DRAFT_1596387 [Mycena galopus ATCC 62051]